MLKEKYHQSKLLLGVIKVSHMNHLLVASKLMDLLDKRRGGIACEKGNKYQWIIIQNIYYKLI